MIFRIKIIFDDKNRQFIYRGLTNNVVDYHEIKRYLFQDLSDNEYNFYESWIYTNKTKLRAILSFCAIRKRAFKSIYNEILQILNKIITVINKGET